jgi:phospholipid-binding lipoprotein MlaA
MKRWEFLWGIALLLLLLPSCAAQQQVQAPPDGPAAAPSVRSAIGPLPPTPAPASGGQLDSEEAILADLANEPQTTDSTEIADPLEPLNRGIFHFNDALYIHVLDPASRAYKKVTPPEFRQVATNFLNNLMFPLRMVSSVLQGKFERAGQEIVRFIINSSMGILGAGDAAQDIFELPAPPKEDLGKVMATWGLGHGFYLVLPVLGPSSLRDGAGWLGGSYLDPVWYLPIGFWEAAGVKSVDWFHRYSYVEGEYADLEAGAVDPYVALRDFYLQYRAQELNK